MAMNDIYADISPSRDEVDALQGPTVIEFGAPWCPHCQNAQPLLAAAFATHAGTRHIKIEDGPGQRLGRSFKVKLWPTLIFMRDGSEIARLVRPTDAMAIGQALAGIDHAS